MIEAGITDGWTAAIGTLILGMGTAGGLLFEQRRQRRAARREQAKDEAEAPAVGLNAASSAAEAIARAAASLIAPFQETIAGLQGEVGALREGLKVSRAAEEQCQRDLSQMREKLREVTDMLGLDPNGGRS